MTTVLVASGGGHLMELRTLWPRFGIDDDVVWATPQSGLSEDLLSGERHVDIPYIAPRDWRGAFGLVPDAARILKEYGADRIVSTGALPAPPFFLAGAARGLSLHYIESVARPTGPSLAGKIVSALPTTHLYAQHAEWATGRWRFIGSVFDTFQVQPVEPAPRANLRVVVTLGTECFGFRRAVERVADILPPGTDVFWQTGHTAVGDLGIQGHGAVPARVLRDAIAAADVVVCHAGAGSAMTALELGKVPVLLPRESRHREHVDDHQTLTGRDLDRRGLAVAVSVPELRLEHLEATRHWRVVRQAQARSFALGERRPTAASPMRSPRRSW